MACGSERRLLTQIAILHIPDMLEPTGYYALVDGVPDWLERSMWRWLMDRAAVGPPLVHMAERL
jgi:hypothetical protein